MLNFSLKPALLAALVLLGVSGAPEARAAGSDILFVLDGSGSMWGQIDGVAKIETARETLSQLLNDVPGEARLGLMTYGATSKTSCEDVAVLNAIGSDRGAIKKSIAGLQPLGKTPIQASLAQGIELLSQAEPVDTPKSLVLISDGVETCGGDPCAMARTAAASGVDMKLHVVGFAVDAEARAQLQCIAEGGEGQYFNASDTAGFAAAMREVVQVAQAEPEPVNQRMFFDDFEGEALGPDWEVQNPDPNAFIVEDSKLLVLNGGRAHPATAESANRLVLKRSVPDGDWDAVIRFNAELKTGKDLLWFGLWTDAENYLGGQISTEYDPADIGVVCINIGLRNRKASSGKETYFDTMLVDRCPGKETRDSWIDSFATGKPYELGLHKRGRNYHVSLGWDAKPRLYKTDPLTSLRLPGKALAIVVGKWNAAAGEMQAMIDAIEITRVSE